MLFADAVAAAVTAGVLTAAPAGAVVDDKAEYGQYAFTAKLAIGSGKRGCTGALVDQQWVLTAADCFADDPAQGYHIKTGAPKLKTTVTVGQRWHADGRDRPRPARRPRPRHGPPRQPLHKGNGRRCAPVVAHGFLTPHSSRHPNSPCIPACRQATPGP